MNKKFYLGWKALSRAKGEAIASVNFQAPKTTREKIVNICNHKLQNTNFEIEMNKLMDKFIKKHK